MGRSGRAGGLANLGEEGGAVGAVTHDLVIVESKTISVDDPAWLTILST